jgi:hypothetical protein
MEIDASKVSQGDMKKLEDLGFHWNDSDGYFYSFKFGSA